VAVSPFRSTSTFTVNYSLNKLSHITSARIARPPTRLASPPEPPPEEERRLSRWPPARFAQFKLETFMPWKTKSWNLKG
jgi:hypothetical protein